jgi:hypothetical protein
MFGCWIARAKAGENEYPEPAEQQSPRPAFAVLSFADLVADEDRSGPGQKRDEVQHLGDHWRCHEETASPG